MRLHSPCCACRVLRTAVLLAEEKLTEEVNTNGWDAMGDVFAFRYLPEDGRPEDGLQVCIMPQLARVHH